MKDSHYCSPSVKKSIQNFVLVSAINKKQSKKEGKKERKKGRYPKNLLYTLHSLLLFFLTSNENFQAWLLDFQMGTLTYAFQ